MQTVTTIGLDIAKSVFQIHGVDAAGQVVIRRHTRPPSGFRYALETVFTQPRPFSDTGSPRRAPLVSVRKPMKVISS